MRGINKAVILATGHAAGTDDDLDWAGNRPHRPADRHLHGMANLPVIAGLLLKGGCRLRRRQP
jgi:uroporphyrin-III C-methyltransferase